MTSDSGGEFVRRSEAIYKPEIRTRLYLHFIPGATSGPTRSYCEKSLAETAAVVTHCVFLLPLGASLRRNEQDKEYRLALGLHKVVSQPFHGSVQYNYNFIPGI